MAVTGTLTATQIAGAGNTAVIWYDSFNKNEYPAYNATDEAAKIDTYAKSKNGNVRPGWVVLNELSSLMRDTTSNGDAYRQWTTEVMSLLHSTYNYNIVLLNQKGTLSSSLDGPYKSTWQSLASNAYIDFADFQIRITFITVVQSLMDSLDGLVNVQYLAMLYAITVCTAKPKYLKFTVFIFSAGNRSDFCSADVKPYNNRHACIIVNRSYYAVCTLVHRGCFSCVVY